MPWVQAVLDDFQAFADSGSSELADVAFLDLYGLASQGNPFVVEGFSAAIRRWSPPPPFSYPMIAEATPRLYRCTQCPRLFSNKSALRGHERLSHQTHLLIGDLDADRQCPYCD
eukprot:440077-Prorocentrum_lima.AAC.1